ncbi:MAG: Holliday junction resolvase RuvX [Chloroflexi bacterium]|nr:Holliday junction resolvase RuvX [Chloroflexota bacterium]MBM3182876.1 Holliday junction resolvase RuvX [Chloroflexota bacterium]MBM4451329.1 Holliday junction resolvase RuvX [Chloroflexota bacterium]MBM4453615.1 Holliday junction resolvase RuvX [Chloroflexota bacterium]
MRVLGLDIGDKRIGVAMSDPDEILASPLATIMRDSDDKAVATILDIIEKHRVQKIVVGLPYSMDGNLGAQANKVMTFVAMLSEHTDVNIETRDERLSTVAVERLLAAAGTRGKTARLRTDAAAAAFVLQGYLDSLKTSAQ